jgi:arylsulfatase A-like enzyme
MTLLLLFGGAFSASAASVVKPHVLFVVSDDLRPTLGAYGTQAITPHVDSLAKRGLTFMRAFSQFPWCSPTR